MAPRKGKGFWRYFLWPVLAGLVLWYLTLGPFVRHWGAAGRAAGRGINDLQTFLVHPVTAPWWLWALLWTCTAVLVLRVFVAVARPLASEPEPSVTEYGRDNLFSVDWVWEYGARGIDPHSIRPRCPQCDYDLRWVGSSLGIGPVVLMCDHCEREWEIDCDTRAQVLDRVGREMTRRARAKVSNPLGAR